MALTVDTAGNISLIQGDTGQITVNGLPTDENYTVYFSIQDGGRNTIGGQLSVDADMSSSVTFELTSAYTDLLTVQVGKSSQTYYYGIKICNLTTGLENTLLIADNTIGTYNTVTVYPKRVEGIE